MKIEIIFPPKGLQYPSSMALFNKTNRQVENVGEILIIVIAKVSLPCATLPKLLTCFFAYFITDLGNDSFELPFPMWFVCFMNLEFI